MIEWTTEGPANPERRDESHQDGETMTDFEREQREAFYAYRAQLTKSFTPASLRSFVESGCVDELSRQIAGELKTWLACAGQFRKTIENYVASFKTLASQRNEAEAKLAATPPDVKTALEWQKVYFDR